MTARYLRSATIGLAALVAACRGPAHGEADFSRSPIDVNAVYAYPDMTWDDALQSATSGRVNLYEDHLGCDELPGRCGYSGAVFGFLLTGADGGMLAFDAGTYPITTQPWRPDGGARRGAFVRTFTVTGSSKGYTAPPGPQSHSETGCAVVEPRDEVAGTVTLDSVAAGAISGSIDSPTWKGSFSSAGCR